MGRSLNAPFRANRKTPTLKKYSLLQTCVRTPSKQFSGGGEGGRSSQILGCGQGLKLTRVGKCVPDLIPVVA